MKKWLKGLFAALSGGVGGAILNRVTDSGHAPGDFGSLKGAVISGAVIGLAGYLTKSPFEPEVPKENKQ